MAEPEIAQLRADAALLLRLLRALTPDPQAIARRQISSTLELLQVRWRRLRALSKMLAEASQRQNTPDAPINEKK
jgi:hypothetical protein